MRVINEYRSLLFLPFVQEGMNEKRIGRLLGRPHCGFGGKNWTTNLYDNDVIVDYDSDRIVRHIYWRNIEIRHFQD
jgi:hypothetical protein